MNAHCDVLVVGAGPAGLARALSEVRQGRDVMLVEQDFEAGGSLLYDREAIDGKEPDEWLDKAIGELNRSENLRLMLEATVVGYYDHSVLTIHDRSAAGSAGAVETFWKVRARNVVLATGAIEQPLMFGNNDLPGVMCAGAMYKYLGRFGVRCADNAVGVVNNDLAWSSLFSLHDGGVAVLASSIPGRKYDTICCAVRQSAELSFIRVVVQFALTVRAASHALTFWIQPARSAAFAAGVWPSPVD